MVKTAAQKWLGTTDAAVLLGISVRYLRDEISKQKGFPAPYRMRERGWMRWQRDELLAWQKGQGHKVTRPRRKPKEARA